VIYGTVLPFLGDVLVGSPETALGATIFTAALADCALVKKAMVGRGVKRIKRAGRPMKEGRGKRGAMLSCMVKKNDLKKKLHPNRSTIELSRKQTGKSQ